MSDRSTTYPFSTLVYVTVTFEGSSLRGSGVLISPDEVLTASHVVYKEGVGPALSTTVSPGYDSGPGPSGSVAGASVSYNPVPDATGLIFNRDSQQDYAVIHLARPVWDVGTMLVQPDFPGGQAYVSGYPGSAGDAQVTTVETVTRDPSFTLLDGPSLGKGSSGGPVWITPAAGPSVVGVVSTVDTTTGAGFNAQITGAALSQISGWVALDDARLHATSTDDFNGDGYSDLTWQLAGTVLQWDMAGATPIAGKAVATLDPSWSFLGSADFQGMGRSAMLWRNTSGLIYDWQMNGTEIASSSFVAQIGPDWHMLATGSLSGTGKSGLLWQNDAGVVVDWQMDGPKVVGSATVGALDPSWRFIAAGDLEGDGTADAVWQNASGTIEEWRFSQGNLIGAAVIGSLDSSWKFLASGDFNGDGRADLMWQRADGAITEWTMNGSAIAGAGLVGTLTPGDWAVVAAGDYNRDGRSDLMLRNSGGSVTEWTLDGTTILSAANVGPLDPSWKALT